MQGDIKNSIPRLGEIPKKSQQTSASGTTTARNSEFSENWKFLLLLFLLAFSFAFAQASRVCVGVAAKSAPGGVGRAKGGENCMHSNAARNESVVIFDPVTSAFSLHENRFVFVKMAVSLLSSEFERPHWQTAA